MRQYMTVAGPRIIDVDRGKAQSAFDLFANIMNEQSRRGWTYHSMETIAITEKPGCFQQPITVSYYMLIFYCDV